jgi:hypothetical protein
MYSTYRHNALLPFSLHAKEIYDLAAKEEDLQQNNSAAIRETREIFNSAGLGLNTNDTSIILLLSRFGYSGQFVDGPKYHMLTHEQEI